MVHVNDGLTLVYDTPDAPVPQGVQTQTGDISLTAILKPPSPGNVVTIRYRVNGGPIYNLRAVEGHTDYKQNAQHFRATFPTFTLGQSVDYAVAGSCVGRRVPDLVVASELPHSFCMANPKEASPQQAERPLQAKPHGEEPPRFQVATEFLARFSIRIEPPRIVGPTPEGIRVTWNAATGTVVGPRLSAKVLQGADWMQIRTDGVGNIDVRALLETGEGVRIMSVYSGAMEFGEDGYQNFLANKLPKPLRAWTTQRFLTTDSTYTWLNRLQCISVGEVFLDDLNYIYDVYTLK
ncbi:MAG: DUF3237 domain-containing protein [Nitrospirota bacterium]